MRPRRPGRAVVREIYSYYKKFGHATEVMGELPDVGEIWNWGVRLLTISRQLLAELKKSTARGAQLSRPGPGKQHPRLELDEKKFRYLLNDDAMANGEDRRGHPGVCRRHGQTGEIHRGKL